MNLPLNSNSCSPVEWGCEMGSCTGGGDKKSHMRSRTPVHVHNYTNQSAFCNNWIALFVRGLNLHMYTQLHVFACSLTPMYM